jgi:predicted HNH restriction endonuclease
MPTTDIEIRSLFKCNDRIASGGGKAFFKIVAINDDCIRIKPLKAQTHHRLSIDKINALLQHYQEVSAAIDEEGEGIERSVNFALGQKGLSEAATETYLWGFVRELWSRRDKSFRSPDEIDDNRTTPEGAKKKILVNAYERSQEARKKCIDKWGVRCVVCNFDFGEHYGELGEGFIHVHHLRPLAEIGQQYNVDPIEDLRPVCPNCHAMLHRGDSPLTIEELKERVHVRQNGR